MTRLYYNFINLNLLLKIKKNITYIYTYCSPKRIKELENILTNYRPDIISGQWVVEEITRAYKSEKPVTSIELYDVKTNVLDRFIEELKELFLLGRFPSIPSHADLIFLEIYTFLVLRIRSTL